MSQQTLTTTNSNSVPDEIIERLKAWQFYFKWWYCWHYIFGIVSIVASLTVAYMAFAIASPGAIAALSLLSAISTALNYFMAPAKCAKGYVQAWRVLSAAIINFKIGNKADLRVLHEAIRKGEECIASQIQ